VRVTQEPGRKTSKFGTEGMQMPLDYVLPIAGADRFRIKLLCEAAHPDPSQLAGSPARLLALQAERPHECVCGTNDQERISWLARRCSKKTPESKITQFLPRQERRCQAASWK